jgi:hypothetical protein
LLFTPITSKVGIFPYLIESVGSYVVWRHVGNHQKMKLLDEHGLWLATKSATEGDAPLFSGQCKEYKPDPNFRFVGHDGTGQQGETDDAKTGTSSPQLDTTHGQPDSKSDAAYSPVENMAELHIERFADIVSQAAGYYSSTTQPQRSQEMDHFLRKTVIVTICDTEFIAHLNNFQCLLDRLGLKFLVVFVETGRPQQQHQVPREHHHLRRVLSVVGNSTQIDNMYIYHHNLPSADAAHEAKSIHLSKTFQFKVMQQIVKLGYNLVFADVDTVIVRDPSSILALVGVDIAYGVNAKCSM